MAHYAKIKDGIVTDVIVAEEKFINLGIHGAPDHWIQTSYNTRGGKHLGPDGLPDTGIPLRKNYAGIGYIYDAELDAFYPPSPFPDWVLNKDTCLWEPPFKKSDL
jgi:hypothetical protein